VLKGSIVMPVKGGKEITLTPGQRFYEGPDDVRVVSRNASNAKPAKFVVFLVKEKRRSGVSASEVITNWLPEGLTVFGSMLLRRGKRRISSVAEWLTAAGINRLLRSEPCL
jgi:hypothetical protein